MQARRRRASGMMPWMSPAWNRFAGTAAGSEIVIAECPAGETWHRAGIDEPPVGVEAFNPVFDVTPGEPVDVIATGRGVGQPPRSVGSRHRSRLEKAVGGGRRTPACARIQGLFQGLNQRIRVFLEKLAFQ